MAKEAEGPIFGAVVQQGLITSVILKPLSEAIDQVKPYRGIVRLIDYSSGKTVWERG